MRNPTIFEKCDRYSDEENQSVCFCSVFVEGFLCCGCWFLSTKRCTDALFSSLSLFLSLLGDVYSLTSPSLISPGGLSSLPSPHPLLAPHSLRLSPRSPLLLLLSLPSLSFSLSLFAPPRLALFPSLSLPLPLTAPPPTPHGCPYARAAAAGAAAGRHRAAVRAGCSGRSGCGASAAAAARGAVGRVGPATGAVGGGNGGNEGGIAGNGGVQNGGSGEEERGRGGELLPARAHLFAPLFSPHRTMPRPRWSARLPS